MQLVLSRWISCNNSKFLQGKVIIKVTKIKFYLMKADGIIKWCSKTYLICNNLQTPTYFLFLMYHNLLLWPLIAFLLKHCSKRFIYWHRIFWTSCRQRAGEYGTIPAKFFSSIKFCYGTRHLFEFDSSIQVVIVILYNAPHYFIERLTAF